MSKSKVASTGGGGGSATGADRRKSRRRPVLESFAIFAVVPKTGGAHRLPVHDLSEDGMRLDLDAEGEGPDNVTVAVGESIEVHLYVNRSLYLPLALKVVRVETHEAVRRIGVELTDRSLPTSAAYGQFLTMLDLLAEVGHFKSA